MSGDAIDDAGASQALDLFDDIVRANGGRDRRFRIARAGRIAPADLDRFAALTSKLQSIQEALTLVLDVARDRRLVLLEIVVILLILLEVILSLRPFK